MKITTVQYFGDSITEHERDLIVDPTKILAVESLKLELENEESPALTKIIFDNGMSAYVKEDAESLWARIELAKIQNLSEALKLAFKKAADEELPETANNNVKVDMPVPDM